MDLSEISRCHQVVQCNRKFNRFSLASWCWSISVTVLLHAYLNQLLQDGTRSCRQDKTSTVCALSHTADTSQPTGSKGRVYPGALRDPLLPPLTITFFLLLKEQQHISLANYNDGKWFLGVCLLSVKKNNKNKLNPFAFQILVIWKSETKLWKLKISARIKHVSMF